MISGGVTYLGHMLKKFHSDWSLGYIVILSTMVKSGVLRKLRLNIWLTKMFIY